MKKRTWSMILLAGLAVGVFILVASMMRPSSTIADQGALRADVDGLEVTYSVMTEEDGTSIVFYDYPHENQAQIRAASEILNKRAAKLAASGQPFSATIVFSQPLTPDEYRRFMKKNGLGSIGSIVRGVDPAGQAVTLGVPPVWGRDAVGKVEIFKSVPANDQLDSEALERLTDGSHPVRVAGVVSTDVTLSPKLYNKIKAASRIYAIDVMQQIILDNLRQQSPNLSQGKIQVQGSILYSSMETTGIAPQMTK